MEKLTFVKSGRASIVEYSLVFVPVISVGHISTTALAAISLGSMTSAVTGRSILQGLGSALDTLLPATWTSSQPHLMGLWAQRVCTQPHFYSLLMDQLGTEIHITIRGGNDYCDNCECARSWDLGNFDDVQTCALQPISFIWLHAEPILLAMKQDPDVAKLATVYLGWSALGLPGSSFCITLS